MVISSDTGSLIPQISESAIALREIKCAACTIDSESIPHSTMAISDHRNAQLMGWDLSESKTRHYVQDGHRADTFRIRPRL